MSTYTGVGKAVSESNTLARKSRVFSPISGRYRGVSRDGHFEIDLRVDIDGPTSLRRISADIFDLTEDPVSYRGSLVLARPRQIAQRNGVMLAGKASFTSETATPWIEVWIARAGPDAKPRATLSRFDGDGQAGPGYDCVFESPHLRSIELTEDFEQGVDALHAYEAGAGRELSIASVFSAAGIDLDTTSSTVIEAAAAGADAMWSDAELHAAMMNRVGPATAREWAVWLLHAGTHERDRHSDGSQKTYGLMFDGRHRRGCAVFYRWLGGTSLERRREQLYACVHEIGHTLNLHHCWLESIIGPARPDALTWMNYPPKWPEGPAAFWHAFAFEFDPAELAHLRHGFRDDVIIGGRRHAPRPPQRDRWPQAVDEADTGLRLRVGAPRELQYGLPMAIELQLSARRPEPRPVPSVLGPRSGTVDIAVRGPDGAEFIFEPLLRHCRQDEPISLRQGDPPVRDSAFVHYGKAGLAFAEPGRYELRARCVIADGSVVLSDPVVTEVRPPRSPGDQAAEAWLYGHEQGTLMSLMGSSAATLAKADDKLQEFIDRHPHHPAADVARIVRGTNAAREFKTIEPNGNVRVVPCDVAAANAHFNGVFDIEHLKRAVSNADDESAAARAVDVALAHVGTRRHVPPPVDTFIRSRRHEINAQLVQSCRM